jgi:hypothetical protein
MPQGLDIGDRDDALTLDLTKAGSAKKHNLRKISQLASPATDARRRRTVADDLDRFTAAGHLAQARARRSP